MIAVEQPRRRWFQFHLSAALVTVATLGVMSWANLRERGRYVPDDRTFNRTIIWRERQFGWPYVAYCTVERVGRTGDILPNGDVLPAFEPIPFENRSGLSGIPPGFIEFTYPRWSGSKVCVDAGVMALVGLAVLCFAEILFRRKGGRTT